MSGQGPVRTASGQTASAGAAPSGAARTVRSRSSTVPSGSLGSVTGRRGWRDLDARLLGVVGRLTERDRLLCRLLDDHRVLTTAQVADVGFSGERRARMRLSELYALDILDRFRPRAWGSPSQFHWVLGPLGAALVAVEAGIDVADLCWRRSLVHELAASRRLALLVGLKGFFCSLVRSARTRLGCRLDEWWSERHCAREWGEVVRPDGYGIWSEADTNLPFLLEYDNGTERLERLAAKLDGYARPAAAAGHPSWVLFSFPSPRSERHTRRVCGSCRNAVTVPKEPAPEVLLLLLSCGHVSMYFDEGVPASEADQWLWTCIECEAEEQQFVRVIATMSGAQVESMTDEQFALIKRADQTAPGR